MRKFTTFLVPKPLLIAPFKSFFYRKFSSTNKEEDPENLASSSNTSFLKEAFSNSDTKEDFITSDFMKDFQDKNFVDKYKLKVIGGKGGNGCVTYYRDRYVRSGAPDGGDGGDGGSFYFHAIPAFRDLGYIKKPEMKGNDGRGGGRLKKNGKDGGDIYYPVPVGTLVWELKTIEKRLEREVREKLSREEYNSRYKAVKRRLLADLDVEGKSVLVAKGGPGGRGNAYHRGITEVEKGKPGEEVNIMLELKCLADIGLVGYPNAGKSTILATLTRAFPKIADYPFTTLQPTVGEIAFIDDFKMTMADIPGIIEGSHENKGLGHEFLRHIERTKLLMFVLDITEKDLVKEYNTLKKELELYKDNIFKGKASIVVLNKADLIKDSEVVINDLKEKLGVEVVGVSAKYSENLDKIVTKLREMIEQERIKEEEQIRNQETNFSM